MRYLRSMLMLNTAICSGRQGAISCWIRATLLLLTVSASSSAQEDSMKNSHILPISDVMLYLQHDVHLLAAIQDSRDSLSQMLDVFLRPEARQSDFHVDRAHAFPTELIE
jgi:hypothetical protein